MENNVYKVYEDEIQLLEEEIKLLAEKYDNLKQESTFYSDEEILTSMYVVFTCWNNNIFCQKSWVKLLPVCYDTRTSLMLFLQCYYKADLI